MRFDRAWMGVAGGMAVGLAITAAVGANAQSGDFTVSAQQLKINQNISSAAVKRSNRSLNYLAPIRTTQTDNADNGSNGVKPLSGIPGSRPGLDRRPARARPEAVLGQRELARRADRVERPGERQRRLHGDPVGGGELRGRLQDEHLGVLVGRGPAGRRPARGAGVRLRIPVAGQPTQVNVRTVAYPAGARDAGRRQLHRAGAVLAV